MQNIKKKPYYITTPIYYTSGDLHLGHCYTTVICDAIARFKRMDGHEVCFLTGTDEHGLKVETAAQKAGKTPKEFVDGLVDKIYSLWDLLGISYDKFHRTSSSQHVQTVQKIFKKLYDQGDLYKSVYEGHYCLPCECFWTQSQLADGKCPDCGREVKSASEEAYFFRLSNYSERLMKLYEDNPEFINPKSRRNEMINNFIKPGLNDLCVSRTTFKWGIPVDFDPKHVVYVWIDALSSYINGLGYKTDDQSLFNKFWPADLHMIGKEIVRFHVIIWPALLMALNLPIPKQVYAHGWLMMNGEKMSKSRGNGTDPYMLTDRYGVDSVRYFLLREIPFGNDGNFTIELFLSRFNSDLCNSLGNLVSRTTAMVTQYFGGKIPANGKKEALDDELVSLCENTLGEVRKSVDAFDAPDALASIFKLINRANKYIDETAPWLLAKDEKSKPRLAEVLYNLSETIRTAAVLLSPFLPSTAQGIFDRLKLGAVPASFDSILTFGGIKEGQEVLKGDALYPRVDIKAELKFFSTLLDAEAEKEKKTQPEDIKPQETPKTKTEEKKPQEDMAGLITFDEFLKVELKTGVVLECEKIEKSTKLLKLKIDVGGQSRTVVSGLALHYKPQELVGKTLVLATNLKPVKLCGVESHGMVLCATCGEKVNVLSVDGIVDSGSKVG